MGFDKKYMQGRTEGMEFALRVAKAGGIEALEEEVRFRQRTGIALNLTKKELAELSTRIKNNIMANMLESIMDSAFDSVMILAVAALHDEYGFGEKRCLKFMRKVQKANEYLNLGYATFEDYIAAIKESMGFEIQVDWKKGLKKS